MNKKNFALLCFVYITKSGTKSMSFEAKNHLYMCRKELIVIRLGKS